MTKEIPRRIVHDRYEKEQKSDLHQVIAAGSGGDGREINNAKHRNIGHVPIEISK